jgi:mRNA interferase MazF
VDITQVRTLSTERLGRNLGTVSPEELARVTDGLFELVG